MASRMLLQVHDELVLEVAPGEDPVEADLGAMVTDPDPGDLDRLRFSLGKVTGDSAGVKVSLSGSKLRAEAAALREAVGTAALRRDPRQEKNAGWAWSAATTAARLIGGARRVAEPPIWTGRGQAS